MANAIPGGNGGHPFSDNPGQVASIHIWWEGAYSRSGLRGIECKYIDGRASRRHGDNGATEFVFTLACEEYLTTIEIWADNGLVHALRFATNQRISHAIGNTHYSGAFHKLSTFHAPKGAVLCGFEGRSGARVDALAPLWDIPSVSGATGMQHRIEITSNDIRQTPRITNRGNIYGNGASGLARVGCGLDKATISRITVMESNGKLMAVTLDYTNSGTVGSGLDLVVDHNDNPETHSLEGVFHLQSNEYIVCIKGQGDGNNIHQLVFVTNTGRFSSRFGSCNRGSQTFELKALGNQPGMALSYLDYSVNANGLEILQAHFIQTTAVYYELTDILYHIDASPPKNRYYRERSLTELVSRYFYNSSNSVQTYGEVIPPPQLSTQRFKFQLDEDAIRALEGEENCAWGEGSGSGSVAFSVAPPELVGSQLSCVIKSGSMDTVRVANGIFFNPTPPSNPMSTHTTVTLTPATPPPTTMNITITPHSSMRLKIGYVTTRVVRLPWEGEMRIMPLAGGEEDEENVRRVRVGGTVTGVFVSKMSQVMISESPISVGGGVGECG